MKWTIGTLILVLVSVVGLVGCGSKNDPIECGEDVLAEFADVSYTSDIDRILASYCLGCHDQTKTGPARNSAPVDVDFNTFAAANKRSDLLDLIVDRATDGTMPPGDSTISLNDKCRLIAWQDGGFVE